MRRSRSRPLGDAPVAAERVRRGAALLEVVVAVTILVVAGAAATRVALESAHAVARARAAERELRDASAFLEAVALWTRDDLDRRLGDRPQGPWRLRVQRESPTLYVVALADSAHRRDILRTSLHRPRPSSGAADAASVSVPADARGGASRGP